MAARQFDGTGAVVVDSPKPASNLQSDFEFYIGYIAALYLDRNGDFLIRYGVSSENPRPPKDYPDALKLSSLIIPPYTFSPLDVKITNYKTQRFTMRDIGRLKDRVERLEDITALTLLERSAESFEIQDQNGLNRFKSGFVVDNFKGHRVGAALDKDYKCAVDIINGELRPKCVMKNINLIEANTTDEARLEKGYVRNGDLITLPFYNNVKIEQNFATRIENVQPYSTTSWVGNITLSPSGDEWFETEVAPTINNNTMGDYDTVLADNQNTIGTFWNAWEVVSVGVSTDTSQDWKYSHNVSEGHTETLVETSIDTTTTTKTRTGVTNTIVEDIVYTNNVAVSTQIIPYVRTRRIKFVGECFMPGKRLYPFFDGVDVSAYCEPLSSDYTNQTFDSSGPAVGASYSTANQGKNLITTAGGRIEGFFTIPDHSHVGQETVPKFSTQKELEFRLTSSSINSRIGRNGVQSGNSTAGQTTYSAVGVLETTQETITGTKNGRIVQTDEAQTTSIVETGSAYTKTLDKRFVNYYEPVVDYRPVTPRNSCPTPDMQISMTNGLTKNAGHINVGDKIMTLHEDTMEWGEYEITHKEFAQDKIVKVKFSDNEITCSPSHKVYIPETYEWVEVKDLIGGDVVSKDNGTTEFVSITEVGEGAVVVLQVEDAHTYICEGILSHNKRPPQEPKTPSIDTIGKAICTFDNDHVEEPAPKPVGDDGKGSKTKKKKSRSSAKTAFDKALEKKQHETKIKSIRPRLRPSNTSAY